MAFLTKFAVQYFDFLRLFLIDRLILIKIFTHLFKFFKILTATFRHCSLLCGSIHKKNLV
jgi:hypothetical protein